MPTEQTFNSLQTTVRAYIERGTVNDPQVYDNLPQLINIAERNIAIKLNVIGVRDVAVSAFADGVSVVAKPENWRRTTSINFGTGVGFAERKPIFPRSYEYCRVYWPNEALTDEPQFYADYDDDHWLIAPTPDDAYPFEITYARKADLLDDTNQTNWLTENWPQLLLYCTLSEVAPFMNNDERVATWHGKYEDLMAAITEDDTKKIIDRATSRQEA